LSNPKKHHYVPRWYLEKFTDSEGYLHVYDKGAGKWRRQRPKEVMAINQYYKQTWVPKGIDPNIFEIGLGQQTEPDGKNALELMLSNPQALTDEHSAAILVYLELQRIRVPRQAEQAKSLLQKTILSLAPQEAVEAILKGDVKLEIKDSFRIEFIRMAVGLFHPWFARMKWRVIEAGDGSSFVTTDSPVTFFNRAFDPPAEPGIGLAGTIVLFPLSSKYLLTMEHPEYLKRGMSPLTLLPEPGEENSVLEIQSGDIWDTEKVRKHNWVMGLLSHRLLVSNTKVQFE
jgi:hypothetical protein